MNCARSRSGEPEPPHRGPAGDRPESPERRRERAGSADPRPAQRRRERPRRREPPGAPGAAIARRKAAVGVSAAGAAIRGTMQDERGQVGDERRDGDSPDAPGPGEHERQSEVRKRGHDRDDRDRALPADGDQILREDVDRLVDEQDAGEDRHHRVAPLEPAADPRVDQQIGDEQERQREQEHQRRACAKADQQEPPLPLACRPSLRSCGERREHQRGRRRPDAEHEREQLRRHRVDAGRRRAEHDPDDDHVGREDDLLRDVHEEVRRAENGELRAAARDSRTAARCAAPAARAAATPAAAPA